MKPMSVKSLQHLYTEYVDQDQTKGIWFLTTADGEYTCMRVFGNCLCQQCRVVQGCMKTKLVNSESLCKLDATCSWNLSLNAIRNEWEYVKSQIVSTHCLITHARITTRKFPDMFSSYEQNLLAKISINM